MSISTVSSCHLFMCHHFIGSDTLFDLLFFYNYLKNTQLTKKILHFIIFFSFGKKRDIFNGSCKKKWASFHLFCHSGSFNQKFFQQRIQANIWAFTPFSFTI